MHNHLYIVMIYLLLKLVLIFNCIFLDHSSKEEGVRWQQEIFCSCQSERN